MVQYGILMNLKPISYMTFSFFKTSKRNMQNILATINRSHARAVRVFADVLVSFLHFDICH